MKGTAIRNEEAFRSDPQKNSEESVSPQKTCKKQREKRKELFPPLALLSPFRMPYLQRLTGSHLAKQKCGLLNPSGSFREQSIEGGDMALGD